jgi:hypothetical protein
MNSRRIRIHLSDHSTTDLELSKATAIRTEKQMIHLDQLPNGTWRLIYNENLIPDFSKVTGFTIVREDESLPYNKEIVLAVADIYNPKYGDERLCECGHPYYRHFDTYDEMEAVGCKYCDCYQFKPPKTRVVHCKKESYDIYIGRPTKWGNPFKIGKDGNREEVIQKYRRYLLGRPDLMESLKDLKGKTLGCWCKPEACHGDVLAELADDEGTNLKE